MNDLVLPLLNKFIEIHRLPDSYISTALQFFVPLCETLAKQSSSSDKPLLIAIHGCQGSGKSTLTDLLIYLLNQHFAIKTVGMSIDDFYLTRVERLELARTVHPLLQTRGVPGTHDMAMLASVIRSILGNEIPVDIPQFDKAIDDRKPKSEWLKITEPVKIVILEGWCVGVTAEADEAMLTPVNELEQKADADGLWRRYVNKKLATDYQDIFQQMDRLIMLKAPGFHSVYRWRLEQEQRLKEALPEDASATHLMDETAIQRFIQHYQRITEHALKTLPVLADVIFEMDEKRSIVKQVIKE